MNNPLVSVIMSTYNTNDEFLKSSINSILNQSYTNFEFIIVCDGSMRDIEIINKYNDNRIKIIKHDKNMGLPYSLNEAIKIAKGKYIARMDSDDISLSNRFEKQVKFLEKHKDIDICSMFVKFIGDANNVNIFPFTNDKLIKIHLLFFNIITHPLVMIRKEFLLDNNIHYNEEYKYSQDYELWSQCINKGRFAIIPRIGLYYRIHNKQITIEKKNEQFEFFKKIVKNNLKSFKNINIEENIENIVLLFSTKENVNINKLIVLSKFVDQIVNENTVYKEKYLKKVLYLKIFNKTIKSKLIVKNFKSIIKNKILRKQIFTFSNIELNAKKIIYKVLCIQHLN